MYCINVCMYVTAQCENPKKLTNTLTTQCGGHGDTSAFGRSLQDGNVANVRNSTTLPRGRAALGYRRSSNTSVGWRVGSADFAYKIKIKLLVICKRARRKVLWHENVRAKMSKVPAASAECAKFSH